MPKYFTVVNGLAYAIYDDIESAQREFAQLKASKVDQPGDCIELYELNLLRSAKMVANIDEVRYDNVH